MNSLKELQNNWKDTPENHKMITDKFTELVNSTPKLKAHRDWVEANMFGFGERAFHWMWKLIVDDMPESFSFLEIGVFRGQVLSLVDLLALEQNKVSFRFGVTPLTSIGVGWESDYKADIERIHNEFDLNKNYVIFPHNSTDREAITLARILKYNIVYIDGGHDYATVKSDLENYAPLVLSRGLLVIDDAACKYNMPWGYFQGIQEVCDALDEWLPNHLEFEELFSVVHNRVFRKK